eukprot:6186133-Pleurochrysis_carterae.AAC.4
MALRREAVPEPWPAQKPVVADEAAPLTPSNCGTNPAARPPPLRAHAHATKLDQKSHKLLAKPQSRHCLFMRVMRGIVCSCESCAACLTQVSAERQTRS